MYVQMDQELSLILGKSDAKQMFISEWNTKYVPAIISYGEKLGKAAISDIISAMNSSGKLILATVNHALLCVTCVCNNR